MTDKTLEFLAETLAAILPDSYFRKTSFPKYESETLAAILPDSYFGKLVFLVIFGLFILTLAGRFELEWIGKAINHLWFRAMWCWRGRHAWEFVSRGEIHLDTDRTYATYVCRYCGEEKRFSGA